MQTINMSMIYYWDKISKNELNILEADIIAIKKNQRMYFLLDVFQMTAIALVSVINYYHINELH